jgi:hypothetical protein
MRKLLIVALLAGATLVAGRAEAGVLPPGGVTMEEVAKALTAKGMKAELKTDIENDPMIVSQLGDIPFRIHFYACNPAKRCTSVMFSAGFDFKDGVSAAKVNEWNRTKRFIRGWIDDEQDPYGVMDSDFEVGATSEAITSNIDTWVGIIPLFRQHFQ